MSYLSLREADTLYQCAASPSIVYHKVDHPLLQRLWLASVRLRRIATPFGDEELVRRFLRGVQIRFDLVAAPIPFNHSLIMARLNEVDFSAAAKKIPRIYPILALAAEETYELMQELIPDASNPLLSHLESQAFDFSDVAVVVRDSRLARASRPIVEGQPALQKCEVVDVSVLRGVRTFKRLFLVGPPSWFPDYVFSAPRSNELDSVCYGWLSGSWQRQSLLIESFAQPERTLIESNRNSEVAGHQIEAWPSTDWEAIAGLAEQAPFGGCKHHQDLIETRLFLLGDGLAVFLEVSTRSKVLVIYPEVDGPDRVRKMLSSDVEPGAYLLLGTEGEGDYISSMADQILGGAAKNHRHKQRLWKERLREKVANSGELDINSRLTDVSIRLLDLGSSVADEDNLRYWLSPRSISPRGKSDFGAIMRLIGLSSEIDRFWEAMRSIRTAHVQAGRRLRRRLVEHVRTMDLSKLQWKSQFNITLPEEEGGRLTAFLVEGRAPGPTLVKASEEGHVFERGY